MQNAKSTLMENLEMKLGRSIEELIREQLQGGRSKEQAAAALGVSYGTLRSWLDKLGARIETIVHFDTERLDV